MATSGSTNFNLTRNQAITEALENVNAVAEDETPSAAMIQSAAVTLNAMIKHWQGKGIRLWTSEMAYKEFAAASIVKNNSKRYTCIRGHTATATTEPGTGATWRLYWRWDEDDYDGTEDAWVLTTAYTTPMNFDVASDTIDIGYAFYRDSTGRDTPIDVLPYDTYKAVFDKDNPNTITFISLEKLKDTMKVHVYQPVGMISTDTYTDILFYDRIRKLEDMDDQADDFDFPQRWLQAIIDGLSYRLTKKYPVSDKTLRRLEKDRDKSFSEAKGGTDFEEDDSDFTSSAYGGLRHGGTRHGERDIN